MARKLVESPMTTRTARAGLDTGTHWRELDPEIHLGYRKGKRAGRWLVRHYDGKRYRQKTLGTADDFVSEGTLSYDGACRAARDDVVRERRAARVKAAGPVPTVRSAVTRYIERRNARSSLRAGRSVKSNCAGRLTVHVLEDAALADTPLHELTEEALRNWRGNLAGGKMTTRKRLASDFRAALNSAAQEGRRFLPPDLLITIKYGLRPPEHELYAPHEPVARDNQILSDTEVRWVVEAARQIDDKRSQGGDLLRMVLVLAATGARFSQVRRLLVQDLQLIASRLMMPSSGKGKKKDLRHIPVPIGRDVVEALRPIVAGRDKLAPLLERWHNVSKGPGKWVPVERRAWRASFEITDPFHEIADAAGLAGKTAMALRHSSIVRHLRIGTPIRLVASLHDTSVEMIEKHYSYWIADGLDEIAARAIVPLLSSTIPALSVVGCY